MANAFQISGLGNQAVEVDPSATGNVIRYAMLFESIIGLPFAYALLVHPETSLAYFLINQSDITPAVQSIAQIVGTTTIMISILLWSAIPNTRMGIEVRRQTYWTLAAAEAMLITLWIYQGHVIGEKGSGCKKDALDAAIMNIAPFCGFRVFVLLVKPQWFGRYRIKAKST